MITCVCKALPWEFCRVSDPCCSAESGQAWASDPALILDSFSNATTQGPKTLEWSYHCSWENESGGKHGKISIATAFSGLVATTLKQEENVFNTNYLHRLDWLTIWFLYFRLHRVTTLLESLSRQSSTYKLSFLTTFPEERLNCHMFDGSLTVHWIQMKPVTRNKLK